MGVVECGATRLVGQGFGCVFGPRDTLSRVRAFSLSLSLSHHQPPLPPHTNTQVPSKAEFKQAAEIFERTFARLSAEVKPSRGMSPEEADQLFLADVNKDGRLNDEELIAHFAAINTKMTKEQVVLHVKDIVHKFDVNDDRKLSRIELFAYDPGLRRAVIQALKAELGKAGILGLGDSEKGHVFPFIEEAVAAFFDQDLLQAVRMFLMNAKGSFGLCVNSSLDAHRQIVVAARGQTISVAAYPSAGLVLWGSEQAACKAAINLLGEDSAAGAVRIDLDDLGGEVCLLDWGEGTASIVPGSTELKTTAVLGGAATLTLAQEQLDAKPFEKRLVELTGNDLVLPLPAAVKDAVGADIRDIPRALRDITEAMDGENAMPTYCLGKELMKRIRAYDKGTHDGSVDVLLTGCEVSLWLGEQFASDLHLLFPKLNIQTVSSNKLLGLQGQDFASPQVGHQYHEESWDLQDTIAIVISHSGGTFGPLAVSNLLQGFTKNLFVITSEWDTQIGKQLRQLSVPNSWEFKASIFSTNIGMRPAEPCTVSVAATHHLLTELLLYLMKKVQFEGCEGMVGGSYSYEDTHIMEHTHASNVAALEEIVGVTAAGERVATATERKLRELGARWSQHVLEGVYSWILVFCYILATVISGYPLLSGIAVTIEPDVSRSFQQCGGLGQRPALLVGIAYACAVVDALIYVFSPQWCCLLLRLVQGRPLLHRMTGRSVVIGDVPWVAQSVEAYLSKLFACSYSAAGLTVYSGNPNDHLVHRLTHRVVRGGLLCVGRPDGRLMALTTAENSVCLSTSQASSIQSIGSTLESITVGHTPAKMGLSADAVFLKGQRKDFYCEVAIKQELGRGDLDGRSAGMLLGDYHNMRKRCLGVVAEQADDIMEKLAMVKKAPRATQAELQGRRKKMLEDRERADDAQDDASAEAFYGENFVKHLRERGEDVNDLEVAERQVLSMRLYEGRVASLQRAVAMFVMFHELGKRVQDFWPAWTLGYLGYDMSRTHSIMRIATTASPVSGAEVRDRTLELARKTQVKGALATIGRLIASKRDYIAHLVATKGTRPKPQRTGPRPGKAPRPPPAAAAASTAAAAPTTAAASPERPVGGADAALGTPVDDGANAMSMGWAGDVGTAVTAVTAVDTADDVVLPGTPDVVAGAPRVADADARLESEAPVAPAKTEPPADTTTAP